MAFKTDQLIEELINLCKNHIYEAERYQKMDLEALNWKENADRWSILECLEHLSLYGDFYIPEIRKRIHESPYPRLNDRFSSGLLGNYFAKSMLPKKNMRKIKTFADKNPNGSDLSKENLDRFIEQQKEYMELLQDARKVNLKKTKTSISITNRIKLRLGDTFRFIKNHDQRHIVQAKQVSEDYLRYEAMVKG